MTFLATRLGGALAGAAAAPEDRVAPLAGLLMVAPAALRRMAPVVVALDRALGALDEADFVQLLPHLRAAFTTLSPLEAEALGAAIAARHGLPADAIDGGAAVAIGEAELSDNLAASRAFETLWREDGLGGWLEAEPRR